MKMLFFMAVVVVAFAAPAMANGPPTSDEASVGSAEVNGSTAWDLLGTENGVEVGIDVTFEQGEVAIETSCQPAAKVANLSEEVQVAITRTHGEQNLASSKSGTTTEGTVTVAKEVGLEDAAIALSSTEPRSVVSTI